MGPGKGTARIEASTKQSALQTALSHRELQLARDVRSWQVAATTALAKAGAFSSRAAAGQRCEVMASSSYDSSRKGWQGQAKAPGAAGEAQQVL